VVTLGEPLPVFELPDLEGRLHSNADYLDRILLIYWWSAHCPECKRVDQAISSRRDVWPSEVVTLAIASNADESREEIEREARARQVQTLLLDSNAYVADLLGASITPYFFLTDRNGVLRYRGALDDVSFHQRLPRINYVEAAMASLRGGRSVVPTETPGYGCTLVRYAVRR
jgi:peroxiredoxin